MSWPVCARMMPDAGEEFGPVALLFELEGTRHSWTLAFRGLEFSNQVVSSQQQSLSETKPLGVCA